MSTSSVPGLNRLQAIYKISLHSPSFSKPSMPHDPTDLIVKIRTSELKNA
jgi:hypothetical protein